MIYNDFNFRGEQKDFYFRPKNLKEIEINYLHPKELMILDKLKEYENEI